MTRVRKVALIALAGVLGVGALGVINGGPAPAIAVIAAPTTPLTYAGVATRFVQPYNGNPACTMPHFTVDTSDPCY